MDGVGINRERFMKMLVKPKGDDIVALLRTCEKCGGNHTFKVGDQTSQCPECNEDGRVTVYADLRQVAEYMRAEIEKIYQVKGGHR